MILCVLHCFLVLHGLRICQQTCRQTGRWYSVNVSKRNERSSQVQWHGEWAAVPSTGQLELQPDLEVLTQSLEILQAKQSGSSGVVERRQDRS